jgi:hypothetical protein
VNGTETKGKENNMDQTQTRINLMRKAPTFEERLELVRTLQERYPFLSDLPAGDTTARSGDVRDSFENYSIISLN